MPDPITLALVGGPIISGLGGLLNGKKQARANKRANQLEEQRRAIQNVLARRKTLADSRRLEAQARAESLAQGIGLSSGADAAQASIDAQTATSISTQRQFEEIDLARNNEIKNAQKAGQRASNADAFGSIISQVGGAFQ